ncbi:ankyrin [Lophium mytilinum]|uniref:Ankyrin n=1 Tax=Lophium mytilinum TaxID=390894 RepID=A0A6A6QJ18_9PEZI|nr:ankyrin [Lophium mytilinum]
MAPTISLSEDAIDDLLYLARVNETSELSSYLSELCAQHHASAASILEAAVDEASGNTSLHYAAANGHLDTLKVLTTSESPAAAPAKEGTKPTPPNLNSPNAAGNTALHWAALNGHLECVKHLVALGADVSVLNKAGHDAIFEAELNDKEDVVAWLLVEGEGLEEGLGGEEKDENTEEAVEEVNKKLGGVEVKDGEKLGG